MTVKIFKTDKTKTTQEIENYFIENDIAYTIRNLSEKKMEWSEFLSIIGLTEDGIESLIPKKMSKEAKHVMSTIDFDTITLKEFYNVAANEPSIIRTPLMMNKNNLMVGARHEDISIFDNRSSKNARFSMLLESVRMREQYELETELGYSLV